MLEQLAYDVTGWRAKAVEFFQLLATTQYAKHVRLGNVPPRPPRRRRARAARRPLRAQRALGRGATDPARPGALQHPEHRALPLAVAELSDRAWDRTPDRTARGRALHLRPARARRAALQPAPHGDRGPRAGDRRSRRAAAEGALRRAGGPPPGGGREPNARTVLLLPGPAGLADLHARHAGGRLRRDPGRRDPRRRPEPLAASAHLEAVHAGRNRDRSAEADLAGGRPEARPDHLPLGNQPRRRGGRLRLRVQRGHGWRPVRPEQPRRRGLRRARHLAGRSRQGRDARPAADLRQPRRRAHGVERPAAGHRRRDRGARQPDVRGDARDRRPGRKRAADRRGRLARARRARHADAHGRGMGAPGPATAPRRRHHAERVGARGERRPRQPQPRGVARRGRPDDRSRKPGRPDRLRLHARPDRWRTGREQHEYVGQQERRPRRHARAKHLRADRARGRAFPT